MPKQKKYNWREESNWNSNSEDGKLIQSLFQEKIVDGRRLAAALGPDTNLTALVDYCERFLSDRIDILQYKENSIRTVLARFKKEAQAEIANTRTDEIVGPDVSTVAQAAAATAAAAVNRTYRSPARSIESTPPRTPQSPPESSPGESAANSSLDAATPMSSKKCKFVLFAFVVYIAQQSILPDNLRQRDICNVGQI